MVTVFCPLTTKGPENCWSRPAREPRLAVDCN